MMAEAPVPRIVAALSILADRIKSHERRDAQIGYVTKEYKA